MKRKIITIISLLTVLTSPMIFANNSYENSPNTTVVETEKGTRIDVVDRPSNLSKDYKKQEQQTINVLKNNPALRNIANYDEAPDSIRVLFRENNNPKGDIMYVRAVTFEDETNNCYVKNVLANEWEESWPNESLKAGGICVKMFAWHKVISPSYPDYNADIDNTTNSQVYKEGSAEKHPNTSAAVDAVMNIGLRRVNTVNDKRFPYIFETGYRAGTYDSSKRENLVSQNGTHYWADQGKDYQWILKYYYNYGTEEFFSYK